MTAWTPKLEQLINEYGDFQEKKYADYINPEASAAGSLLRWSFRWAVKSRPLYKKICKEAGWDSINNYEMHAANYQKMIDLAAQKGSPAADKIKAILAIDKQDLELALQHAAENPKPFYGPGLYKHIKLVKQQGFKL